MEYTDKTDIPQYKPTGKVLSLSELIDEEKTKELIAEIEVSKLSQEEQEFLKKAAYRHLSFNYRNIAEYYANADKEMQNLMEKSALVIIDYNNAIKYGYTKLSKRLQDLRKSYA